MPESVYEAIGKGFSKESMESLGEQVGWKYLRVHHSGKYELTRSSCFLSLPGLQPDLAEIEPLGLKREKSQN